MTTLNIDFQPTTERKALRALMMIIAAQPETACFRLRGDTKRTADIDVIVDAAGACDEQHLDVFSADGERIGCFWIVWGNSPEEIIADYVISPFADRVDTLFQSLFA